MLWLSSKEWPFCVTASRRFALPLATTVTFMKVTSMRIIIITLLFTLTACSALLGKQLNERFGIIDASRYDKPIASQDIHYHQDIQPIFDNRCVVCHACYDAPCQLTLSSWEGLSRGGNKSDVYNLDRLLAAEPSRLHIDAHSNEEWRNKHHFHGVLNERENTPQANIEASVLAQVLLQKKQQPLPADKILSEPFDFSLKRESMCPRIEEMDAYRAKEPLGGMPYGLPAIPEAEYQTLMNWIEAGSPVEPLDPLPKSIAQQVKYWEAFLNQDDLQAQLMSRYLYEHLFLANFWFVKNDQPLFFKLLRSRTPPGQKIDIINTRTPLDNPNVARVYYRLARVLDTPVRKTHMPYQLNSTRMQNWKNWFLSEPHTLAALPSYDSAYANNPFLNFKALPLEGRYRFLLDEAEYTIMGFIKGPVCRGQIALNVINDYFWVAFVNPNLPFSSEENTFLQEHAHELTLPAAQGENANPLNWLIYAKKEKSYLEARITYIRNQIMPKVKLDLNLLWDGDQTSNKGQSINANNKTLTTNNPNARLTIFRHMDNATVVKGLQGDAPQTMWLIDYPLLERIHYLLVAGYDVYGNLGHQVNSRVYMDFLRMEGERNFLALLPRAERKKVHDHWYRGSITAVAEYVNNPKVSFPLETDIHYKSDDALPELYQLMQQKFTPLPASPLDLRHANIPATLKQSLQSIHQTPGQAAQYLPQMLYLAVFDPATKQSHYFTLLHNNSYSNISHMFGSESHRLPEEDTLLILNGLVGAHPQGFLNLQVQDVPKLSQRIAQLNSSADYSSLLDTYGIRRSSLDFWGFSDRLHNAQGDIINAGIFDYNRFDNQ